jgi:hypothetical protein
MRLITTIGFVALLAGAKQSWRAQTQPCLVKAYEVISEADSDKGDGESSLRGRAAWPRETLQVCVLRIDCMLDLFSGLTSTRKQGIFRYFILLP